MSSELQFAFNHMPRTEDKHLSIMSLEEATKARKFHESFPQYTITPLADLKRMAEFLGLSQVKVKDESCRFGLNAFKVLGGSYAIARYIADQTGCDISELLYSALKSEKLKREFGAATFFFCYRRQCLPAVGVLRDHTQGNSVGGS